MSSPSPTIKETKETIYYGEVYAQVKKKNEKEPSKKKEQREKLKQEKGGNGGE